MFLCWGDSYLGIAFSTHPGNQASSRGEAKDTALLWSCDGYILELTVWPKKVKPPVEFGERTQDCSPGHTAKEGPHLLRMRPKTSCLIHLSRIHSTNYPKSISSKLFGDGTLLFAVHRKEPGHPANLWFLISLPTFLQCSQGPLTWRITFFWQLGMIFLMRL